MNAHTLAENFAVRMVGTPATWAAAAVKGSYVQLAGIGRRALIVCMVGELDADLQVEVFEAQDSNGTGAQEITTITTAQNFTNGTDEGRVGLIEVLDSDLSAGYTHITVEATPGATDQFGAVILIGDLYKYPASNATTDGVAFSLNSW